MLSHERLQELLAYCPATGDFHWKVFRNSQAVAGQKAGHLDQKTGYIVIGIKGKVYQAHRLAWLYTFGAWPQKELDHINHLRDDNRIENLREVTRTENQRNRSKNKQNSSGHTGVYPNNFGSWIARICVDRRQINLGTFRNLEDAVSARKKAEAVHDFHPNHGT